MSTITASQEQQVVDQVPKQLYIAGEWRDGAKGTHHRRGPVHRGAAVRGRRRVRRRRQGGAGRRGDAGPEFAAMAPRERGEILRRAFETIIERKDDLALLMTLEMGKTIKESLAEITYAAGVLPLVLRGGGADRRPLLGGRQRRRPGADDEAARRPLPDDHALELPAGDGHPQDRPRRRRRLHDGGQARAADAAVDADAGQDPRGGRPPRRRPEPDHRLVVRRDDRRR